MRILHLSDLHFGELLKPRGNGEKSAHMFIGEDNKPNPDWLFKIITQRDDLLLQRAPDIVIISGDIAWSSEKEDYEYALTLLKKIDDHWKIPVVVAPGNHDVNWNLSKQGENPQKHFIDFLVNFYGQDTFKDIYQEEYDVLIMQEGRKFLSSIHRLKSEDLGTPVLIVSVNSAHAMGHDNTTKETSPRIHPTALLKIEERISKLNLPDTTIKIFVLHHHLLPFIDNNANSTFNPEEIASSVDRTMIANSAQTQQWLGLNQFDIALHGHKHLSHSRIDKLVADRSETRRSIVISGAGSAGVHAEEIPAGEKLSFSIVDISHGTELKWSVRIENREIQRSPLARTLSGYIFQDEIGERAEYCPNNFASTNWQHLHAAIANKCWPSGIPKEDFGKSEKMMNFISTVSSNNKFPLIPKRSIFDPSVGFDEEWTPPKTSRKCGEKVNAIDIEKTFRSIHPEYELSNEWRDKDVLDRALREQSPRFHFRHGSRLFETQIGKKIESSQLWLAAQTVSETSTHAYASTFRPEIDVKGSGLSPAPSLIGIQFFEANKKLNLIATFRNLELSYWWVVNMVELTRILYWALESVGGNKELAPGFITIMSPVASWNWDPKAPSLDRIDELDLFEMSNVVKKIFGSEDPDANTLFDLLREKAENTNIYALEDTGLRRLADVVDLWTKNEGLSDAEHLNENALKDFSRSIKDAARSIRNAIREKTNRAYNVDMAKKMITKANVTLGDLFNE